MSADENDDLNLTPDTEVFHETLASQEEIYLEQREEELNLILDSYVPPRLPLELTNNVNERDVIPENLDQLLDDAAKELMVGDVHRRPMSKEQLWEMLKLF